MANQYTTGQKIEFLGSALSGRVPQFEQKIEQLDEKRMEAMYKDAGAAYDLFNKGNIGGIIDLANDRLNILQRLPGSDPSDTYQVLQLSQAAQAGDPQARSQLGQFLEAADVRGRSLGFDTSPLSSAPATFQSRHMMALAAGFAEGSPEYQDFMARGGLDETTPGRTRYRNGASISFTRGNKVEVVDETGQVVTGQAAKDAVARGLESGVLEQGAIAAARATETGIVERASDLISRGTFAAESLPTLNRAIELMGMDTVQTGGFNTFRLAAENLFGVVGEDEGEVSNLLGKAVLKQLRETFGAAFTAKEGEQLTDIESGFGKNKATNLRLLQNARDIATNTARRAQRAATRAGDENAVSDIQEFLDGVYNLGISLENEADVPRNAQGFYMFNNEEEVNQFATTTPIPDGEVVYVGGQPFTWVNE